MASGVGTTNAISFAVGAQALLILAGAVVLAFAALLHGGRRLALAAPSGRAASRRRRGPGRRVMVFATFPSASMTNA